MYNRQNQIYSQNSVNSRGMSQPSDYPYYNRNLNDDYFDINSTSNDCRSLMESQFSQRRKTATEEICSLLTTSLESSIPRIADQCVNIISSKIEAEISKQSNNINLLKEDIKKLKESIHIYSESDFSKIETSILDKIQSITKEIQEKQKSLEFIIHKNNYKGGKNIVKTKENIIKYLNIIKEKSGENSNQINQITSSLNNQSLVNEICCYLDESIKNITSKILEKDKSETKDLFKGEEITKKLDFINEFLEQNKKEGSFKNMAVNQVVSLSFPIEKKKIEKEKQITSQNYSFKEEVIIKDEIFSVLNNFEKMKNVQPLKRKQKKNKDKKQVNMYSQFYF